MAASVLTEVIRRIGRLAGLRGDLAAPDEQLLRRFTDTRDEAAFSALVSRHGPMVLGLCRQLLDDPNDVDDAFQATFLVLVQKIGSIRKPELLGNWLYGVAYKVAARARSNKARRRTREGQDSDMTAFPAAGAGDPGDLRPVLHEEVHRLPDKYRGPVVLCFLEGKTHEEAAQTLRWPVGSVKGRLARAKEMLRSRLARRGVTLTVGFLATALASDAASAAVPGVLLDSTIKAAMLFAAGNAVAGGVVSAQAIALSKGVIETMFWNKMKIAAALVLSITVLGSGAGLLTYQSFAKEPQTTQKEEKPKVPAKEAAKPENDNKVLQGNWRVVTVEKDGKEADGDEIDKMKDARWNFSDGRLSFVTQETESRFSFHGANYKLNPERKPKELDVVVVNLQGETIGKSIPAIYAVEGDGLKICTPANFSARPSDLKLETVGARPKGFSTEDGDKTMLITLRRDKGVNEYDFPDATDKSESVVSSRLHTLRMLSTEDIEVVRKWYEKKLGIEHDSDLGHHGTRSQGKGSDVAQVASDSTNQHNGVTTPRPVKVYFLTDDTHYHWLQIVLTRAEGEMQTHIVVTFVPKK